MTEERTREGSRAMTIQTNIRQRIGSIEKMKALLAACLMMVATLLAASLLAPGPAQASAFPGANGKIVFSSDRTTGTGVHNPEGDLEIFTMNPDGTALKQLTKNTVGDFNPSYSSDGKKIAFSSARAGNLDIFVMNAGGTNQTNLTTKNTGSDFNPTFSPDGKKIAFETNRTDLLQIFVMNIDGSNPTNLTSNLLIAGDPAFSPKGDKIAFESNQQIFVMDSNGTGQTPLTDTSRAEDPTFSPDGNKIAFESDRDGGGDPNKQDIYVMNADGSNPVRLTDDPARDAQPAFSPDGKKIAFVSERDGDDEDIFVMNAGGTNQTNLTPNTRHEINPDWQPVAATFTVTSDSDPGDGVCNATSCTLREAIDASNSLQAQVQNKIKFNIPGGGVRTITPPTTALPQITSPVVIDGYTQPGASPNTLATGTNAALKIELNGTNTSSSPALAIVGTSHSVIRGLAINRFGAAIGIFNFANGSQGVNDTRIEGNFLGTDPSGTLDRGNNVGVQLDGGTGNVVGGAAPAARNLVSGNGDGIELTSGPQGSRVLGNLIGTTASGTAPLGNDFWGVVSFGAFTSDNEIGDGTLAGANTIAFNGRDGIEIDANGSSTGNTISRNSVFSNAGLGIDLIGASETDTTNVSTPNDTGDADSGANNLQNKPVLASAKSNATSTTVTGNLNSTPNETYALQFYSNPSGNEGKKFIGQKSVTTGGSGNATFTFSPASKVAVGQTITATATKSSTGDTSEFSAPRKVASS
jgi:CSLREA domain-containing protein